MEKERGGKPRDRERERPASLLEKEIPLVPHTYSAIARFPSSSASQTTNRPPTSTLGSDADKRSGYSCVGHENRPCSLPRAPQICTRSSGLPRSWRKTDGVGNWDRVKSPRRLLQLPPGLLLLMCLVALGFPRCRCVWFCLFETVWVEFVY